MSKRSNCPCCGERLVHANLGNGTVDTYYGAWVDAKHELPKGGGDVLGMLACGRQAVVSRSQSTWFEFDGHVADVTHWMPLTDAP